MNTLDILDVTKDLKTPMYLFNIDELRERITMIRDILGEDIEICYAMKANPFLLDGLKGYADSFEVCSPGEFSICERENIPMKDIVLSGVNKEKKDIEHVLDAYGGKGVYTVESFTQLNILNECAGKRGLVIDVLLRLTSGNQFGINEEDIYTICADMDKYPSCHIKGIQCYTGTQKKNVGIMEKEIAKIVEVCDNIKERFNYDIEKIEYGPGLMVSYFGREAYDNNFDMLRELKVVLDSIRDRFTITLEMGRYIAAACGYFVTQVVDMKKNDDHNFLIIDGGINHINYYGQTMAMKVPAYSYISTDGRILESSEEIDESRVERWTICGSLCTVADLIVKNLPVIKPSLGDKMIFRNIGAYSVTEGIYLFLSRRLPVISVYTKSEGIRVYRDLMPSDIINSRQELL